MVKLSGPKSFSDHRLSSARGSLDDEDDEDEDDEGETEAESEAGTREVSEIDSLMGREEETATDGCDSDFLVPLPFERVPLLFFFDDDEDDDEDEVGVETPEEEDTRDLRDEVEVDLVGMGLGLLGVTSLCSDEDILCGQVKLFGQTHGQKGRG
jgi:hypothetical protein